MWTTPIYRRAIGRIQKSHKSQYPDRRQSAIHIPAGCLVRLGLAQVSTRRRIMLLTLTDFGQTPRWCGSDDLRSIWLYEDRVFHIRITRFAPFLPIPHHHHLQSIFLSFTCLLFCLCFPHTTSSYPQLQLQYQPLRHLTMSAASSTTSQSSPSPPPPSSSSSHESDTSSDAPDPVWLSTQYKTDSATWDRSTAPIDGTHRPPTLDIIPDRYPQERKRLQDLRDGIEPAPLPKVLTAKERMELKLPPFNRKPGPTNTTMSTMVLPRKGRSKSIKCSKPEPATVRPRLVPLPHLHWFDTPQGKNTLPDCPSLFHFSRKQRLVDIARDRANAGSQDNSASSQISPEVTAEVTAPDCAYPQTAPAPQTSDDRDASGQDASSARRDGLPPPSDAPSLARSSVPVDTRVGRPRSNAIKVVAPRPASPPKRPRPFKIDPPLRDPLAVGPEQLPRLPESIKGQKAKIAKLEAEEAARRAIDPTRKLYVTKADMAEMEAEGRLIGKERQERKAAEEAATAATVAATAAAIVAALTTPIGSSVQSPPGTLSSEPGPSRLLPRHASSSTGTKKLVPKHKPGSESGADIGSTTRSPNQNVPTPTPFRPAASPRGPYENTSEVLTKRASNIGTTSPASAPRLPAAVKGKGRAVEPTPPTPPAETTAPLSPQETADKSSPGPARAPAQDAVEKRFVTMRRIPKQVAEHKATEAAGSSGKTVSKNDDHFVPQQIVKGFLLPEAPVTPGTDRRSAIGPKVNRVSPSPVDSGLPKTTDLKQGSSALPTTTNVIRSRSNQPVPRPKHNDGVPRNRSEVLCGDRLRSPRREQVTAPSSTSPRVVRSAIGSMIPIQEGAQVLYEGQEDEPPLSRSSSASGTERTTSSPQVTSTSSLADMIPMRVTASGIELPRDDVPGKLFFFPELPHDSVDDEEDTETSPNTQKSRLRSLSVLASAVCSYIPFVTPPRKEISDTSSEAKETPTRASAALSSLLASSESGTKPRKPLVPIPTAEWPDGSVRSRGSQLGPSIREGDMRLSTIKRNASALRTDGSDNANGSRNRENMSPVGTTVSFVTRPRAWQKLMKTQTFAYELSGQGQVGGAEMVTGLAQSPTINTLSRPDTKSRTYSKLSAILRRHDGTILAPPHDPTTPDNAGSQSSAIPPTGEGTQSPANTSSNTRSKTSPQRVSIIGFFENTEGEKVLRFQKEALAGGPGAVVARFSEALSQASIIRERSGPGPSGSSSTDVHPAPDVDAESSSSLESAFDYDNDNDDDDWEDDDSVPTPRPSPPSTLRDRSDTVVTVRTSDS